MWMFGATLATPELPPSLPGGELASLYLGPGCCYLSQFLTGYDHARDHGPCLAKFSNDLFYAWYWPEIILHWSADVPLAQHHKGPYLRGEGHPLSC